MASGMAMVYFAEGVWPSYGRLIKIGFSTNVRSRMIHLSKELGFPVSAMAAVPGSSKSERYLHQVFADDRVVGEWFKPSRWLSALVKRCIGTGEMPLRAIAKISRLDLERSQTGQAKVQRAYRERQARRTESMRAALQEIIASLDGNEKSLAVKLREIAERGLRG